MINKNSKIFVAGHRGLIGSAIVRKLNQLNYKKIYTKTKNELDLRDQKKVLNYILKIKPDAVILAAAKVGGIEVNNKLRGEFIYDNLSIQNNVIHSSYLAKVKNLIFLGSSCIYPKLSKQPIKEKYLLSGQLEKTNEPYAIAKIAGLKMCQFYNQQYSSNFISLMPTNLYGSNDNFDLENSHVLPALIRKFHEAKINSSSYVKLWGTGTPKREFLHVDDLANACVHFMHNYNENSPVNIGTGKDIAISDLAYLIKDIVGYSGEIRWDSTKPDGTPRKLLDISKAKENGWTYSITLEEGIRMTYDWYVKNEKR